LKHFIKEIKERVLLFDGSKGTMLQQMGMSGGECPEAWNSTHSEEVKKVYALYKEAGSDVIQTNTFQGNRPKLEEYGLGDRTHELNYEGARLARNVMGRDGFVAASIGPVGKLFEPSGELTFQAAYEVYREQVKAVAEGGADIINFETFTDIAEMRAALLAAKETVQLPVICSMSFEANGRTLMGTDPYTAGVILKSLGADMMGTNCSLGPEHLLDILRQMAEAGGIPLSVKPNAGLPEVIDGKTVYRESPEKFARLAGEFVRLGVRLIGGCCGTTPEFIKALKAALKGIEPEKLTNRSGHIITSSVKVLNLDAANQPTIGLIHAGKDSRLLHELRSGNYEYIVDHALELSSEGYDAIWINIDEVQGSEEVLGKVVNAAQGYLKEPFILETGNAAALAKALRVYKGKAGVIVNDLEKGLMEELLMAARKYGSTIVDKSYLER
jgi:5-methyltetrahydrofolate--homocysteine methyltransferase